jgi:hypothetical protein
MTSTVTEVLMQPAGGSSAAVQMARRDASGAVLCCAAPPPPGATTLRCRFPGGADVPAQRCATSGGVTCVPPACDGAAAAQPYQVFADDALLAEGVYDAAAEPPPKPLSKRHGLKPFVIMCVRCACQRPALRGTE